MAHLPRAVARVRHALREFLIARRAEGSLAEDDLLLVGCSGGADSLALASQLAFVAPRMGLRAGLITIDHRMQEGSAEQAARVLELGSGLGLEPAIARVVDRGAGETADRGVPSGAGLGPEGAARELRYAAFADVLGETGARAVLLGHTMEDQAETVLLGLARGAGTRTIAGIPPMRGRYWRPLLGVRRAETAATCTELGLPVWQDPTNAPEGPWLTARGEPLPRAALRHTVLPEFARAIGQDPVPALARTADLARSDADFLDAVAREHFSRIERVQTGGATDVAAAPTAGAAPRGAVLALAVEAATSLADPLRWRLLREFLLRAGAPEGQVSMRHIHSVDTLLTDWRGQRGASVPGGLRVVRSYGRLYIVTPSNLERT